jgi:hypothetical protein
MAAFPPSMADDIRAELRGENVLWSEEPGRASYARSRGGDIGGGIFVAVFAVFWLWMACHSSQPGQSPPWPFIFFGAFFLLGGLCRLLSRLIPALIGGRIFYVITDQRAIIFEKIWRLKIQSFNPGALDGFERISRGGRSGDLILKRIVGGGGRRQTTTELGFFGLDSFAEPEALLRDMVKQHAKAR